MSDNNQMTCELKECKNSVKNPITLPCGYTICQLHVEQHKDKFKCPICDLEHTLQNAEIDLNNNNVIDEMCNCVNFHFMDLNEQKNDDIKFDEFEKISEDLSYI
jgi:hypothetical protein